MKMFAFDLIDERLRAARKVLAGVAGAGLLSFALVGGAAAQDTAASGNGGTSGSDASGGPVAIGTVDEEDDAEDDFVIEGLDLLGEDIAATVIGAVTGEDEAAAEGEAGEGEDEAEDDVEATDDSVTVGV